MKVAFITTRLEKASARYRFGQFLPILEEAGIEAEPLLIPSGAVKRFLFFRSLSEFDIVFLQKKLFGGMEFRSLRRNAKKVIYDFDDAVMFNDSSRVGSGGDYSSSKRSKNFERTIKAVDGVVAGNEYLKSLALEHNENVIEIPTSIDTDRYDLKDFKSDGESSVTLGWIGSKDTIFYLKNIETTLGKIFDSNHDVRLKIISDEFIDYGGIPITTKHWNGDTELDDLKSFDIGIMPLTEDPWSRGKCGFKLLQYMALGIASVASPVGVNSEIIEHGVNGFLADSEDEWVDYVGRLASSPELRQSMGERAVETVRSRYSRDVNGKVLADYIKSFA